ncbi:MarR family transcriptional regulator [Actinoplanes sp. TBRC 11911]|uniref:MarR family winged helix-turn-helix transcriptional regulator n=1 Tax=Actinoplanes sp. TBRC 11911 TaxID=2729386 RepID=UPI00145DF2FE|nr:MarR family transcriptional regulator [Actinoplanes sp. TBRC 11911]NMO54041.1 MarR family transcriptional regulator [Actinoplanes sp. TBRC 11911]
MSDLTPAGAATRRRMTTRELAIWRSLIDTTTDLRRLLTVQLASDSNLSPGDYAVLLALSESQERKLRSSELAAAIDWERSRLSHHLGRMEKRGLIRRVECLTDSRGAEVELTEDGARIFRGATTPHTRAIKQYFADALSPEQFESLDEILCTLNNHLSSDAVQGESRHE